MHTKQKTQRIHRRVFNGYTLGEERCAYNNAHNAQLDARASMAHGEQTDRRHTIGDKVVSATQ